MQFSSGSIIRTACELHCTIFNRTAESGILTKRRDPLLDRIDALARRYYLSLIDLETFAFPVESRPESGERNFFAVSKCAAHFRARDDTWRHAAAGSRCDVARGRLARIACTRICADGFLGRVLDRERARNSAEKGILCDYLSTRRPRRQCRHLSGCIRRRLRRSELGSACWLPMRVDTSDFRLRLSAVDSTCAICLCRYWMTPLLITVWHNSCSMLSFLMVTHPSINCNRRCSTSPDESLSERWSLPRTLGADLDFARHETPPTPVSLSFGKKLNRRNGLVS